MGIEEMSDREALTRLMADLGGLGDAESRHDEDENLSPYRPQADTILEAGFRRDAEPSEDAVWAALEPFLETSIRLDLNELEDNQSFAEMVKAVAAALRDPEAERAAPVEYEYGWAPHATSKDKLPTEAEAREAYSMAIGYPVRRWKRELRDAPQWIPAEEEK